jgi:hypothetical protein
VPFTPAHAAAALLFQKTRFFRTALVVGCIAPDLEYLVRLNSGGSYGHTLPGLFVYDLPMGLLALWIFHTFLREPIWALLPLGMRRRLNPSYPRIAPRDTAHFLVLCASILIGSATHIAWDEICHNSSWLATHWSLLTIKIAFPFRRATTLASCLQLFSSVFGLAVLLLWAWRWYKRTPPHALPEEPHYLVLRRWPVPVAIILFSLLGAFLRTSVFGHARLGHGGSYTFISESLVTAISCALLALLFCGSVLRAAKKP